MTTLELPAREKIDADANEAREALERFLMVWAGPGSGKSHLHATLLMLGVAPEQASRFDWTAAREDAYRRFRSGARQLSEDTAWADSELARELLDQTHELHERMEEDVDGNDPGWRVKEAADQLLDLLSLIQREAEHNALDDPPVAARYVIDQLPGVDQEELADLFGVESRTVRDWKAGKTRTIRKHPERITLVAQLVYDLRRAMTPRGAVSWFKRSRPQLDGRTPLELIQVDADTAAEMLRPLARGVRGQLGA